MIRLTQLDTGRVLPIPASVTIEMERRTNVFDVELSGSYSYPFTLLLTPEVRTWMGWTVELDVLDHLPDSWPVALDVEGYAWGVGLLRLQSHSDTQLRLKLQLGLGAAMQVLKAKSLRDFALGGVRSFPRTVNGIPGLVALANDTVARFAQHDYVFAPLVNYQLRGDVSTITPDAPPMVNRWYFGGAFGGRPAYGTFLDAAGAAADTTVLPASKPSEYYFCPYPKYAYLVRALLLEAGVPRVGLALDAELAAQLVVLSNEVLSPDAALNVKFSLGSVLPDVNALDFLTKTWEALGLYPAETATGVQIRHVRDVLRGAQYTDLTDRVLPGFDERSVEQSSGLRLTYQYEDGDTQTPLYYPKRPARTGPDAATWADLPQNFALGSVELGEEVRRVLDENRDYVGLAFVIDGATIGTWDWKPLGTMYPDIVVGDGSQVRPQGIAATAMQGVHPFGFSYSCEITLVPRLVSPLLDPDNADAPHTPTQAIHLAFYRGRRPPLIDEFVMAHPYKAQNPTYPLLTPLRVDQLGNEVGQRSLVLDTPEGTYEQFLKELLQLRLRTVPVKRRFRLSNAEIAALDLNRRILVDGQFYIVRRLSCTLPLTGPVTLELLPLR
jgi:hypothetical protein